MVLIVVFRNLNYVTFRHHRNSHLQKCSESRVRNCTEILVRWIRKYQALTWEKLAGVQKDTNVCE